MDDYIKRNAVLQIISDAPRFFYNVMIRADAMRNHVKRLPAADAVEIVWCKDCKHKPYSVDGQKTGFSVRHPDDDERCPCLCDDGWYSWMPEDDFYCANGERRTEDG